MKVGVVGYGSIGKRHAANLRELGYEPVIYDPMFVTGIRFERHVYETCDAVVIATPTRVHTGCIRACAERGRHMLIEKPIAARDNDLQGLLDLAAGGGAVVMMGNNLRFHPCVQQAKAWIDQGLIGDPLWANFICAAQTIVHTYRADGVILNTGAHEVDVALHLLGPARVISANADGPGDQETIADFVLLHDNGCRSSFHLDFITPKHVRDFWIAGDERNIGVNLLNRVSSLGTVIHNNDGSYDDDYLEEMKAFLSRIDGGPGDGATGADGLATLKILLDVRRMVGLP